MILFFILKYREYINIVSLKTILSVTFFDLVIYSIINILVLIIQSKTIGINFPLQLITAFSIYVLFSIIIYQISKIIAACESDIKDFKK